MIDRVVASLLTGSVKLLTGAQCQWIGCGPYPLQRIYCANHSSHLDFILLWSALPRAIRRGTRPVAAADYWFHGHLRQYLIERVFHGVRLDRSTTTIIAEPLQPMINALREGSSLILFPEGTRGDGEQLQSFKAGIYYLARAYPEVEIIPVWMENSYRVMPKGYFLPVPLLCSVRFGSPLKIHRDETRPQFLDRLKHDVEALGKL